MKVLICGSRGWKDHKIIWDKLDSLPRNSTLITGGARGVDEIASRLANNIPDIYQEVYIPDWDKHGRAAGPIRNSKMLEQDPDEVWAFWDGRSKGTQDTIRKAMDKGIEVKIYSENKK